AAEGAVPLTFEVMTDCHALLIAERL
ncbi:MAG: hypothetical protein QOH13_2036, partial [Thermoleophilaceae bacterium]|nr:hypothetical protein [Thermoleophilaceae bacterium]